MIWRHNNAVAQIFLWATCRFSQTFASWKCVMRTSLLSCAPKQTCWGWITMVHDCEASTLDLPCSFAPLKRLRVGCWYLWPAFSQDLLCGLGVFRLFTWRLLFTEAKEEHGFSMLQRVKTCCEGLWMFCHAQWKAAGPLHQHVLRK